MNAKTQSPLQSAAVRSTERGFTLVEIMVVIVILGLLATLVVPAVMGQSDEAKAQKAFTDCKMIASQVRLYYVKHSRLPETLEDLVTKNEKGMSYLEELPVDPWDSAYVLLEGDGPREYEVISCGPDTQEGSEDDISSKSKKDDN